MRLNESDGSRPRSQLRESHPDMPKRRRGSPSQEDIPMKKSRSAMSLKQNRQTSRTNVSNFTSKQCVAWFHEYAGPDEDMIGPEGMEKFCEDIGVEPENVVMLCLAWKLGACNMGFFTLSEWLRGMTDLQADTVVSLQRKLDYLKSLLDDPRHFKDIYRYAYDFARDKNQRSMDVETGTAMLSLLLGKNWSLYSYFHQFLEQSKYRVINKDQWCNILEFSRSIKPDLSNYDEDGAWPVLLDEFVDWYCHQIGCGSSSKFDQSRVSS